MKPGYHWDLAEAKLRDAAKAYGEKVGTVGVNPMPALIKRLTDGERTDALYRDIMSLE